ncbi:hypothetical protein NLC35_03790 [Candidatus Aminicenantes bacterium AC-334-K16]|nr:hypothetical protein [Candidatus Aminicenantes bacterium AC-334-K16]
MKEIKYKIDQYRIEIYSRDMKGKRTRWADRIIYLFSEGKEVAQAVFAVEGEKVPEPFLSDDKKIFFFAASARFLEVLKILRSFETVYIIWQPIYDPKEKKDGDAYFLAEGAIK